MCEPSVALECGSEQPRARLTAGPDVREHPCQPRWASFLKVSCGKTAVKTRAFRSEIIIMSVTVDSSRDEAFACAQLIIRIKIRDLAVPIQFTFRRPCASLLLHDYVLLCEQPALALRHTRHYYYMTTYYCVSSLPLPYGIRVTTIT